MSIQKTLSVLTGLLVGGALAAAIALGLLTSIVDRNTDHLGGAVARLHLAETAAIDLLTHARSQDPVARGLLEAQVRAMMRAAGVAADRPDERAALAKVEQGLDLYFGGVDTATGELGSLETTIRALGELIDIDVQEATANREEAGFWDEVGTVVGISVAVLLAIFVSFVLVATRAYVLRPILALSQTMRAFGAGARDVRANETGPSELRAIARQFNEMGHALARQREQELVFLAGVAHDLRNPLSALRSSASLVAPQRPLPPEPVLRSSFALIGRQVGQLDRMVSDLLDTARIEAGRLELRIESCDARQIVQDTVDLFGSTSDAHPLVPDVPEQPILVRADPLRLGQVLNNLVSNAIKYSPGGGTVKLTLSADDGEVCFSVADRGTGIAAEDLPHVFEPFRRAKGTRDDIPGVGLGLSVARRIVEAHGGRIEVDSELGRGTAIRMSLPR